MAKDIKVKINLKVATGKVGFGYPLIFAGKEATAVAYTECATLEAVKAAGFTETTDVYKAAQLIFMQDNRPTKIAVCASTDNAVTALPALKDKGWRQLIVTSLETADESTLVEIAKWVETTPDKMYFASVTETTGFTDIKECDRTVLFYYNDSKVKNPVAALVGEAAGKTVGSFTYKNLILKGITPLELTDTEIEAVHTAGCITFVTKAGDNVTTEGKVVSGEYIDIIDSIDFIVSDMEYRMQKQLNMSDKISYDNNGIAILESVAVTVLQEAYTSGIIAVAEDGSPDYKVEFAPRSATSINDRKVRAYNGGKFSFGLAGAIHYANIIGEIEV